VGMIACRVGVVCEREFISDDTMRLLRGSVTLIQETRELGRFLAQMAFGVQCLWLWLSLSLT
jgi:hypothetical protein